MHIMMEEKRDELIRQLKLCGASIVENAESIIGTEERLVGVTVTIDFGDQIIPTINVDREFVPEGF